MLGRRNYEAIADILGQAASKEDAVEKLVEYFKAENPKFDELKFRERMLRRLRRWEPAQVVAAAGGDRHLSGVPIASGQQSQGGFFPSDGQEGFLP